MRLRTTSSAALAAAVLALSGTTSAQAALPAGPAERAGVAEGDYLLAQTPGELTTPRAAVDKSGAPLPDSASIVAALAKEDGKTVTFDRPTIIDFGRYVVGFYERKGATNDPASAFPDFVRDRDAGNGALNAVADGTWQPARYVTLPAGEPIDVVGYRFNTDLSRKPATLPMDPDAVPGAFLSSDETLTRSWYGALSTMQQSIMATGDEQDYLLYDGPERDRAMWLWYDSTANRTAYFGLGALAKSPAQSSYEEANCAPGVFKVSTIVHHDACLATILGDDLGFTEWELWEVLQAYDNKDWFNRRQLLAQIAVHLETSVGKQLDPVTGLYRTNRLAVPPAPLNPVKGNDGSMPSQMWAFRGFLGAARIARAFGDETLAARFQGKADALRQAVNTHLWDNEKGAFVFFKGSDHVDQLGNAMAVMHGLATPAQATRVLDYLRDHHNRVFDWKGSKTWGSKNPAGSTNFDRPFLAGDPDFNRADWDTPHSVVWGAQWGMGEDPDDWSKDYNYNYGLSPWAEAYEVEAYFANRRDTEGLDLLRRAWGTMLKHGPSTFYEQSAADGTPAYRLGRQHNSVAHRWGAGNGHLLQRFVLGVDATSPGFKTWRVDPHGGDLRWAQGRVPTPAGPLSAWWERSGSGQYRLAVDAPAGTSGEVRLPVDPDRGTITVDGEEVWRDGRARRPGVSRDEDGVVVTGLTAGEHVLRWVRG